MLNLIAHSVFQPIFALLLSLETHNELSSPNPLLKEYDFIVIGAGSAGSVVASRLSEDPSVTVLLLEAGGSEGLLNDVPGTYPLLMRSESDWQYATEPQRNCFLSMDEQRARWPRGKILGGSSSINGMIYLRGHPRDYDNWARMGNTGWSYAEVLPYFKRSERNVNMDFLVSGVHGENGPLPVSVPENSPSPLGAYFIEGAKELGFREGDLNGIDTLGIVNFAPQHILHGMRHSESKAFLESVSPLRGNLHIHPQSFVMKILFSHNKDAEYVRFRSNGRVYTVRADKEIILSAGALSSPQLLLLSGVGPKRHLFDMDIRVVADLPGVGKNLHDHVYVLGIGMNVNSTGPGIWSKSSIDEYMTSRTGPLAHFDVPTLFASSSINPEPYWPDIEINALTDSGMPTNDRTGISTNRDTGLKVDVHRQLYGPYVGTPSTILVAILSRPKSRGYLHLKSNDPYDHPVFQPNYLTHPYDVRVLVESLKIHYMLGATDAFKHYNAKMFTTIVPGCEPYYNHTLNFNGMLIPSDHYLECVVRHMTFPGNHQVGSCKMGPPRDPLAVVDPRLRVYNVQKLRVIDASIMPLVTDANTNAAAVMIGEMGSQLIKDDYNLK